MEPITLYLKRDAINGKVNWIAESFLALKNTMVSLPDGMFKIFIQQVKRTGGWRYKFHFGHVLPMICEYMNRNGINQVIDPGTGEALPIDIDTLHEYHKQVFNPGLVKNLLKRKDANGIIKEYLTVPLSTTKLNDGEFINRFEEQIISTYANEYGIEFLSRDEFRQYFEDGKDCKLIVDMQMEIMAL